MKIANLRKIIEVSGEYFGRYGFGQLNRLEIIRNDNAKDREITIEAFSKRYSKGYPCMICLSLEGARELYAKLGHTLNPSDDDLS